MFPVLLNTESTPVVLIRYLNNFGFTEGRKENRKEGKKWREERRKR